MCARWALVVGVTDAGTLTITDFLWERIAEDEAAAGSYHRLLCMRTACDNEGCVWDEQERMADERVCTCGYPARVLAECKAKRAIVEREEKDLRDYWRQRSADHMQTWEAWASEWQALMSPNLCDLAAVYASHPDYNPAWAPES